MTTLRARLQKLDRISFEVQYDDDNGDDIGYVTVRRPADKSTSVLVDIADVLALLPHEETPRAQQASFRDARGKHRYEDEAMKIVDSIHEFFPQMDDNDGGEILGWILQLTEYVHAAAEGIAAPPQEEQEREQQFLDTLYALQERYGIAKSTWMYKPPIREAFRKALTAPRADAAAGWQSIETAPKNEQVIFFEWYRHRPAIEISPGTYRAGDEVILPRVYIGQWWAGNELNRAGWADSSTHYANPTHWHAMLPAPPRPTGETEP